MGRGTAALSDQRRGRIAPDERDRARTELRRRLAEGPAAHHHRLGAHEDEEQLLAVREALSPVAVQELAVDRVEVDAHVDAKELLEVASIPVEVVPRILPARVTVPH